MTEQSSTRPQAEAAQERDSAPAAEALLPAVRAAALAAQLPAPGTSQLLDVFSEALFLLDDEGRLLTANSAAEALLGRTRRALRGTSVLEMLPEAENWLASRSADPAAAEASSFMLVTELARGLLPPVKVRAAFTVFSAAPFSPADAGLPADAAMLLEAAELDDALRAERDAIAEASRAANSELLRNLAHEIKNPLGGIRGAAQLLETELVRAEDRECTSVILEEAARLQELVDRLLMPYRAPAASEAVNIHEVLEHVRSLISLEFGQGLLIERDYDISAPAVSGDRGRCVQIFLNLARNAAEAMTAERARGTARLKLRTRIARDVMLGGTRRRIALRVDITDNGPGVPEALRERIFFPLVTGRAEGSGLGLALVKTFVEEAGGSVTLESRPGRTVFTVLLPL